MLLCSRLRAVRGDGRRLHADAVASPQGPAHHPTRPVLTQQRSTTTFCVKPPDLTSHHGGTAHGGTAEDPGVVWVMYGW